MTPEINEILSNKEIVAIDQDALGQQGRRISKNGEQEIWARPLNDGSRAVILFNRGAAGAEIAVSWQQLSYPDHLSASVRDLWAHKDLGKFTGSFSSKVPSHGVVMVKVLP
jgi:alpha-galactosidase